MKEEFIGESLIPDRGSFADSGLGAGAPLVPEGFTWRGRHIAVTRFRTLEKGYGDCRHGSGERYVRRHWFEVDTDADGIFRIYVERQGGGRSRRCRWHIYSRLRVRNPEVS